MIAKNESYLTLREAARYFPTRPHLATVWRWAAKGVKGVRLETVVVGGQRFTTAEACDRFIAQLNGAKVLTMPTRAKQLAAVDRDLDAELT